MRHVEIFIIQHLKHTCTCIFMQPSQLMDATTTKDSHTYKVPSTVHLASCSHRLLVSFGIVPPQVEGSKKGEN